MIALPMHPSHAMPIRELLANPAEILRDCQERVNAQTSGAKIELVSKVHDDGVWVENEEGRKLIPADTVIVCVGTTPLREERDSFRTVSFDVINIGDCKKASNMQHAIETGFDAGLIL